MNEVWNLEPIYRGFDDPAFARDFEEMKKTAEEFAAFAGKLEGTEPLAGLKNGIALQEKLSELAGKLGLYASLRQSATTTDPQCGSQMGRIYAVISGIAAPGAAFTKWACGLDNLLEIVDGDGDLKEYRYLFTRWQQENRYLLPGLGEEIMARMEMSGGNAWSELQQYLTSTVPVSYRGQTTNLSAVRNLAYDSDPAVRKAAFETLYRRYREYNNTISTLYNYNVKKDVILSGLRNYSSALSAALSPENIPESVYHNLIHAVHEALPAMHRYVAARKKALKLDSLHMYDVYTPLVSLPEKHYTFEEAVDIACEALKPLGEDYVSTLRTGILEERWVDIMENKGKTSGAYSFGVYDSDPYILMNFKGTLKDIFTLVHEGGHSMHSWYTRKTQPYIYGEHSIFTAEVASTVNETLLIHYLLQNTDSPEMRKYLINFYIDEFKSTLFRQTMFAEFEWKAHQMAEAGEPLTAELLDSTYEKLNQEYFGPDMDSDEFIQYEWSRIPHFFRSFYVFQYATGYSAANALANRILTEGAPAVADYRKFLTLGDSMDPIDLLKIAGVDMSTEEPVRSALDTFARLVDELIREI